MSAVRPLSRHQIALLRQTLERQERTLTPLSISDDTVRGLLAAYDQVCAELTRWTSPPPDAA